MEECAVCLQKVTLARSTVELAPRATAGMAIGPQVAQTEPAPVVTVPMRTKVRRGVDRARASVGRRHRSRRHRRWGLRRCHLLLTQGTMGLFRQAGKGFGLGGAAALGLQGLGLSRYGRSRHAWLRLGEVQNDEGPDERRKDAAPSCCPPPTRVEWGYFTWFWGRWN